MLNKEFIQESIAKIQELLEQISVYKEHTLDDIVRNFHLYASLRYAFIELIERAVDINQHMIREYGSEAPKDYTESFTLLSDIGVLNKDFAEQISKSVGLRNIVVHEYDEVDDKRLYYSIDIALEQYPQYCQAVLNYIQKNA